MKKCFHALWLLVVILAMLSANVYAENASKRIIMITLGEAKFVQGREDNGTLRTSINEIEGLETLADAHTTIIPPDPNIIREVNGNDYLFFVTGLVLSGKVNITNHEWTLGIRKDYTLANPIPHGNGKYFIKAKLFGPPLRGECPDKDATFDLSYAANGSVIIDPTKPRSEGFLMIYEGTNKCSGAHDEDSDKKGHYASIGIATSQNYGRLWPFYRNNYNSSGPYAPATGAFGSDVCISNQNCQLCFPPVKCASVPSTYGRYPVLMPTYTVEDAIKNGRSITMGYQCSSAFLDDIPAGGNKIKPDLYVYSIQNFSCRDYCLYSQSGLTVSRAKLNGGEGRLVFTNWYKGSFNEKTISINSADSTYADIPDSVRRRCEQKNGDIKFSNTGLGSDCGGLINPIGFIPPESKKDIFRSCLDDNSQHRMMGSISYVPETKQYLLTFVCSSPKNPNPNPLAAKTAGMSNPDDTCPDSERGEALFFSTVDDLSEQEKWSTPQQIVNSWTCKKKVSEVEGSNGKDNKYCVSSLWYPSFMSLNSKPGYLKKSGYVFSMEGCMASSREGFRRYISQPFTIITTEARWPF